MHHCQLHILTGSLLSGVSIPEYSGSIPPFGCRTCCKRSLSFPVSSSSVKKDPSPCSSVFPDDSHCIGCNGNVCNANHTQRIQSECLHFKRGLSIQHTFVQLPYCFTRLCYLLTQLLDFSLLSIHLLSEPMQWATRTCGCHWVSSACLPLYLATQCHLAAACKFWICQTPASLHKSSCCQGLLT